MRWWLPEYWLFKISGGGGGGGQGSDLVTLMFPPPSSEIFFCMGVYCALNSLIETRIVQIFTHVNTGVGSKG